MWRKILNKRITHTLFTLKSFQCASAYPFILSAMNILKLERVKLLQQSEKLTSRFLSWNKYCLPYVNYNKFVFRYTLSLLIKHVHTFGYVIFKSNKWILFITLSKCKFPIVTGFEDTCYLYLIVWDLVVLLYSLCVCNLWM